MIPRTPKLLETAGKKFWKKVLNEFEIESEHDLERLFQACRCLDEIADAETVIKAEGLFIEDRFKQRREHPGAKLIRDNKTLFCRIIRELGLDLQGAPESRPPRQY